MPISPFLLKADANETQVCCWYIYTMSAASNIAITADSATEVYLNPDVDCAMTFLRDYTGQICYFQHFTSN